MRALQLIVLLGLPLFIIGRRSSGPPQERLYQEVSNILGTLSESFAAKDFVRLSQLYTDDFVFMPPGAPMLRGRSTMVGLANQLWENGVRKVEFEIEEVVGIGPRMAYSIGHVKQTLADGTVGFNGKYLDLFKKVEGKWYLFIDIFNSVE